MPSISLPESEPWVVARWAFRRLLTTLQARYPEDSALVQQLEASMALDGLHLDLLEPELAHRTRGALLVVVVETLNAQGRGDSSPVHTDPEADRMYAEALAELRDKLKAS